MVATVLPSVEPKKRKRDVFTRSLQVVPIFLAVVLLTAAFFKGSELATEELSETTLFTSRWFLVPLVLFELGLACWLLGGLYARWTRWLLLLTFLAFFETALFFALAGYASCRCLGRASVAPWVAAIFDGAAIGAIMLWQPAAAGPTVFSHRGRFAFVGVVYAFAALPALVSMVSYTPTGQMPRLRSDLELAAKVKVQLKNATPEQLLDQLRAATGLSFSVDDKLTKSWPADLSEIKTTGVPAWAFMELLAHKQSVPVRWEKTEGGYRLVRSAPLGRNTPWLISAAALALTGVYLLFSRVRTSTGEPDQRQPSRA